MTITYVHDEHGDNDDGNDKRLLLIVMMMWWRWPRRNERDTMTIKEILNVEA